MKITSDIIKVLSSIACVLFLIALLIGYVKGCITEQSIRNDEREKTIKEIKDGEYVLQQKRDVQVLQIEKKIFERDKKLEKETDPIKRATIILDSWGKK